MHERYLGACGTLQTRPTSAQFAPFAEMLSAAVSARPALPVRKAARSARSVSRGVVRPVARFAKVRRCRLWLSLSDGWRLPARC